ncbi:transposase [Streptomyces virginiae]|uniref:transposase n=1 Tax=Streptomyces virginiae TaxID=1961 RepID=UPI0036621718
MTDQATDQAWEVIGPLPAPPGTGRRVFDGTLWQLSTRASWRDLPERHGPCTAVHERHARKPAMGL